MKISLKCQNFAYSHFDIFNKEFKITTNVTCSHYAESYSTVELTDYFRLVHLSRARMAQYMADQIDGMQGKRNEKYPDFYAVGNNMVIGVNEHAAYSTAKDEYVRIENNGNEAVFFYGVKIGDTRTEVEKKFSRCNIRTWDNGKTYSNANGWKVYVTFENGRLRKYSYLCKPTS